MSEWKKVKIGEFLEKKSIPAENLDNYENLEVLGVSNKLGITKTDHKKSKDISNYLYIEKDYFAYNPYRINVGSIGLTPDNVFGLVSPAYVVFKTKESYLLPELLLDFLKSHEGLIQINKLAKGTVRKSLSFNELCNIEMIVPPIENQRKILQIKKSVQKEIDLLSNEISNQQTYLTKLRQAILQEAIEGKLTAQWRIKNPVCLGDPNTDAAALLTTIKTEKQKLITEGKIKKEKPLAPINPNDIPFTLPNGWVWVRLCDISKVGTGATPLTSNPEYYQNGTVNWVTSSSTNSPFVNSPDKLISELAIKNTNCTVYPVGTLIIAMYGQGKTRGQISELCIQSATNQAIAAIQLHLKNDFIKRYTKIYFQKIYNEIRELASGGAQPNLNMDKIKNTFIPLPPLAEQQAIVERVDLLLNHINTLEQQVTERKHHTEQLMQAVLKEAFTG